MFDWSQYKGNLTWLPSKTCYLTISGSHSYGTNIATSDLDIRGVTCAPKEYYLGFNKRFEQAECKDIDLTIFDIKKYIELATNANPNVLELLFTDPVDHLIVTSIGQKLIDNRELFLSNKCKYTYAGYAHSQLNRIKTHRNWLLNPPTKQPTRSDYGLPERTLIPRDQLEAANASIKKRLDEWNWKTLDSLDPATSQSVRNEFTNKLCEITGWNLVEIEDKTWQAAVNSLGITNNFVELLDKERRYQSALNNWRSYQDWKTNRNPVRAEMEAKYQFDCYSDDTEFLTKDGFKNFNDITENDELATVFIKRGVRAGKDFMNRADFLGVEYQKYTDKFNSIYSGPMYHLEGIHTDTLVTANHRILFRKIERNTKIEHGWQLEEASILPDCFDILIHPTPHKKNYSNKSFFKDIPISPEDFVSLVGWYLSDGCMIFYNGDSLRPKEVRISQDYNGKLSKLMNNFHKKYKDICNIYTYKRQPNFINPHIHYELVLIINENNIVNNIYKTCSFKENKVVPRWAMQLSKRLKDKIIKGLIKGDGTERQHKTKELSYIYYSKSKKLVDTIQELAILAGWETSLYGPYNEVKCEKYTIEMYQLHLRKNTEQFRRFIRSSNVKKINVENQKIVCFTVPNGTLITRRKGKIGIHGNCKHGLHLARLLIQCKEMLRDGKLIVKRPDTEFLLSIRNGAWSYDKLIEWTVEQEKEIEELVKTSKLPHSPDRNKIDSLCVELIEESFK